MPTPEPTPEQRIIEAIDQATRPKQQEAAEDERIVLARLADQILADELAIADWIDEAEQEKRDA